MFGSVATPCIINAFEDILENSPYLGRKSSIALKHPAQLRTDQGKEFKNRNFSKFLKKENIHHFYALNPDVKAAMVERLIRTLKNRLNKFLTHTKKLTFNSHDQCQMVLKKLIHSYNHRLHTSLGISPMQVNLKTQDSIRKINSDRIEKISRRVFKVGDLVRITRYKNVFSKGYLQNFTTQPFTILRESIKSPKMYTLKDQSGDIIEGRFYSNELIPYYGK